MLLFSASRFLDLLSSLSLCEDFEEVLVSELALPLKKQQKLSRLVHASTVNLTKCQERQDFEFRQ